MENRNEQQKAIKEGRLTSLLRGTISEFLREVEEHGQFITVSFIQMNKSKHTATVYCTVFPAEKEERSIAFLKRREPACRQYIRKHTNLRIIPTVRFALAKRV